MVADRTVYVSGCLGLDKDTGKIVSGGVAAEAELTLSNLKNVLIASGSDLDKVVKATIFLQDLNDFETVNEAYKNGRTNKYFWFLIFLLTCSCSLILFSISNPLSSENLYSSGQVTTKCSG